MSFTIERAFVGLRAAQIHYRQAGSGARRPLVMVHASPSSSRALEPMIRAFASDRRVIAPDTLGNGDSTGPIPDGAPVEFFADTLMAALDRIGLERFDLYGTHTGGSIATELAIKHPDRVSGLVLDGVGLYEPEFQAELLQRYAPALELDHQGMYLAWVWHFVRDTYMFWPWYRLDREHRRSIGLPPARELHAKVVEVLKAAETYHHSYRAAIRYDKRSRIPKLKVPTLAACAREDMLSVYFDELARLVPEGRAVWTEGAATAASLQKTVETFRQFFDSIGTP